MICHAIWMDLEESRRLAQAYVAAAEMIGTADSPKVRVFRALLEATEPVSEEFLNAEAAAYYTYDTECTRRERKAYVKGAQRVGLKR